MADRRTRLLRAAFVLLLAVSCAQVIWWVIDQRRLALRVEATILEAYELDRRAAERLLDSGSPWSELEGLFPHLDFDRSEPVTRAVQIGEAAREEIARERRRHVRQYGWEAAFFLVVLIVCMTVLWRGLREEARLRVRHESFLATVSHELRSPLSSLRLQTQTMQRRSLAEDRREELLRRSESDLDRLEGLVDNVLEAARIDDARKRDLLSWHAEPVPVAEAVKRQVQALAHEGADERVEHDIADGVSVLADRRAFETILRNLLANALRATESGGRVVVEAQVDNDDLRLKVVDSGEGFAVDESDHLFEKFYRPGDALSQRSGGTGLGLYIVRQLVRRGGGSVTAMSQGPGTGATFELTLPAAEMAA
ncbi:MAG: HAMP domain-containing sensor histidine kinase [Acidobacteriota bacterium]